MTSGHMASRHSPKPNVIYSMLSLKSYAQKVSKSQMSRFQNLHMFCSLSLSFSPSLSLSLSLSLSVAFYSLFSFAIPFATFLFIFAAPCDRGSLARNFRRLVDLRVFFRRVFAKTILREICRRAFGIVVWDFASTSYF